MTLHPDFTGILDSLLSDKYQTLRNHTCEARARIITAFSSRPATVHPDRKRQKLPSRRFKKQPRK